MHTYIVKFLSHRNGSFVHEFSIESCGNGELSWELTTEPAVDSSRTVSKADRRDTEAVILVSLT
jgi:hypothetical protein